MKYDWAFLDNVYNKHQIQELNRLANTALHYSKDDPAPNVKKTAYVKPIKINHFSPALQPFLDTILHLNSFMFGFDLFQIHESQSINYNVYNAKNHGEYSWHSDGYKDSPSDIKLTAIANISEEKYEGGDFELFLNGSQIVHEIRNPGTVIVFPGYIQHRVTPVTKGCRITISKWLMGPNWK